MLIQNYFHNNYYYSYTHKITDLVETIYYSEQEEYCITVYLEDLIFHGKHFITMECAMCQLAFKESFSLNNLLLLSL